MIKNVDKIKISQILKKVKTKPNLLFIFLLLCLYVNAQNITKPFLPKSLLPLDFKKQINIVNKEFTIAYGMRLDSTMRDIRNYTPAQIDKFIFQTKDYEYIFRVPFWIAMDSARYVKYIPELILKLTDTTYIGLTNAADVTIWSRLKTGQMKHNPLNYQIDDDVFTVAGRASWILKRLSKNEYGIIKPGLSLKELQAIQKQWIKWLNTLVVQKK
jgi:hypothetical protein